ncbi:hypothetical protein EC973_001471 [Apophysomyces ossiformis]|uniref:Uncharacterized protein n=1 Tax=Apophysomyces ossiformis TaxID=679940 RepID=A0A8H7ERV6_9FUNG|nr:hypothetical protein EC973_001471 [Apophysomyces ossiformis]
MTIQDVFGLGSDPFTIWCGANHISTANIYKDMVKTKLGHQLQHAPIHFMEIRVRTLDEKDDVKTEPFSETEDDQEKELNDGEKKDADEKSDEEVEKDANDQDSKEEEEESAKSHSGFSEISRPNSP